MDASIPAIIDKHEENEINVFPLNFYLKKEIISDKNNKFILFFKAESESELNIKATKEDLIQKNFSNKFSVNAIKENKDFVQFDNLKEICEEISVRTEKETITLIEEKNSLIISIPLPSSKFKEIFFELKQEEKGDRDIIKKLTNLIIDQKKEISNLKIKINELNNLKSELNELKIFKKEISLLFKNYIINLDSLIIDNILQNSILKEWINPKYKIRANLLYRHSRDGPEISTFHKLCDNKGATLTIMHIKNVEHKIGFFVNSSFDSISQWKKDPNCFLFNLNQNKKYKKINNNSYSSFFCDKNCGPSANWLGCNPNVNLNYIFHGKNIIDNVFENGSMILPYKGNEVEYEVNEMEIFQIIIDEN